MPYAILVWALLSAAAAGKAQTPATVDWTETGVRWYSQSYWQDPKVPRKYTFAEHADDKVVGRSSVLVHMQVAASRPNNYFELRMRPAQPMDLSAAEAIEVSLKVFSGGRLRPVHVYLCSPGFRKLTIAKWPAKLDLSPGSGWQRAVLDLTEARVLDKDKPGVPGEYDRRDVTVICLNFEHPDGAVDDRLLIDGMRAAKLPPPAVKREEMPDGSYVFTTSRYRVVVGANGYMQSLRAGPTEFLRKMPPAIEAQTASACFVDNNPAKGVVALGQPKPLGRRRAAARGEEASVQYLFRAEDFDVIVQQRIGKAGLLQFALSPEVVAALDCRTDRALRAAKLEAGPQIDTRLVTSTGAVLLCDQPMIGYSRMSMGALPGGVWSFRHVAYGQGQCKLTLRPIGEPTLADGIGFDVRCADPDFLLPGGKAVHFDITATSYCRAPAKGRVAFQVCDYLTREPVAERVMPVEIAPGQTLAVPTDVTLTEPGPYRGKVVVTDSQGGRREVGWVFTYDFPKYKPELTRQPDFRAFWQETLAELATVPMDAQLTLVPEQSTAASEAYKLSLATLGGRRVYCWYCKPRKPGLYPTRFEVPSSGVYPVTAARAGRSASYCGLWMSIHGLPVDLDPNMPRTDAAAWGYWTYGIESPKTSMWRTIYASLVRGVDFLCSRQEVDPKRIMVAGGSQGGGLSMVLAGLDRRIAFAAPAHSGLPRLDWTVLHGPGFWPFRMGAKPKGQTTEQFLKTLSYFDAANFTPDIACPVAAEVSLLDTVCGSGNQICALAHVKPGLLQLICDPWRSHASGPRGGRLRSEAVQRWLQGQPPVKNPTK